MVEQWKDIDGHEGRYQVSSLGNARSLPRKVTYKDGRVGHFKGRNLAVSRGANGYRKIDLGRGYKRIYLHHAVANAFLGPKPEWAECINHKDGDKQNNAATNLEWTTHRANNLHARNTGLNLQHGENCNLTVHSDALIGALRRVYQKYKPTGRELSDLFDMPETTISQIIKGKSR